MIKKSTGRCPLVVYKSSLHLNETLQIPMEDLTLLEGPLAKPLQSPCQFRERALEIRCDASVGTFIIATPFSTCIIVVKNQESKEEELRLQQ